MSQAIPPITPITLRGSAGTLAAWEAKPAGTPRGTVVLVPGFTGSKEDFEGMLPLLAQAGYRAVAYDQRGQWESEGPDDIAGYTMDDFRGDLLGVIDQVSPDEPVHLVGHSFGGYVSRVAVIAEPKKFRSLTLLASGPSSIEDINFPPPRLVAQMVEAGGAEVLWQQLSAAMQAMPTPPTPQRLEFLHNRILRTRQANILGILKVMEAPPVADPAVLREAGVPILVAFGDTNDLWDPAVHRRFAAQLDARTAEYPGSGHVPNEDVPERVCADLVNFWRETA